MLRRLSYVLEIVAGALLVNGILIFTLAGSPTSAHPPADSTPVSPDFKNPKTLRDPCEKDPKNLVIDGAMGPDRHDTPFGTVADGWDPFVAAGAPPQFRVVDNEGIDSISQQIYSTDAFDAGVMQTVHNLQLGTQYWIRLGWAPAAKSFGGANDPSPSVGDQVGVDPFGGTNPNSPNVTWGPALFNDNKALNRLQLIVIFPARSPNATVFLHAIARDGSGGENRVWLDAVCMEARPDLPTVPIQPTPVPLPPTATPVPPKPTVRFTSTPTRTRTPTKTPLATTVALVLTLTPTAAPPAAETASATPTRAVIRARPPVTPSQESAIDLDSGTLTGVGAGSIAGALIFFVLGLVSWRRSI